jgi:hypothetical protein
MKEHNKIPTLLIIMLLIVVSAIVFFAHYSPYEESDGLSITLGGKAVDEQIQDGLISCVQEQMKKTAQRIGEQGYIYNKENTFKRDFLEDEIEKYISENFFQCRMELQEELSKWTIAEGEIKADVEIKEDEIIALLKIDLIAEKEFKEKSVSIEIINAKVQLPLGKMLTFIQQLKEEKVSDSNGLCLTCVYDLAEENDVILNIIEYTDSTVMMIEDNNYNMTFTMQGEGERE